MKKHYESTVQMMREDMRRIKDEWEKKLVEEQLECQRQLLELQAKHSLNI